MAEYIYKGDHRFQGMGKFGIWSVCPNYTFALGPFAIKVGPFAPIIKKYFNEDNAFFNLE